MIKEENLQENALKVGTSILEQLAELMKEFPNVVGDVRGKGLMIGLELVADPDTREPLPADQVIQIFEDVKDSGVLIGKGGVNGNVSFFLFLHLIYDFLTCFSTLGIQIEAATLRYQRGRRVHRRRATTSFEKTRK